MRFLGALLSALVFFIRLIPCNTDEQQNHFKRKVIVIGAGAAGLSAAQRLLDHNIDVEILEARDTIGGRIQSQHVLNGLVIKRKEY